MHLSYGDGPKRSAHGAVEKRTIEFIGGTVTALTLRLVFHMSVRQDRDVSLLPMNLGVEIRAENNSCNNATPGV